MVNKQKTAFIFPGQGSQFVGMGKDIYQEYPTAKAIYDKADEVLDFSISSLSFEGPEDQLKLTENTQPAILTTSIALLKILQEKINIKPAYVAGHSLGEYSALVCARAISFEDAVLSVNKRGQFMQSAVPVGMGAMAAIIKTTEKVVQELCDTVNREGHIVVNANINCPGQYVISGHTEAVKEVMMLAKEKRAIGIPLAVSAPFHSPLMQKAADDLETWLNGITFNDLNIPLINNADVEILTSGEDAKTSLIRQMQSSVKWEASMRKLINKGVNTFVEIGPGKVLSGMMKRVDREVKVINVFDITSLNEAVEKIV
ncbi:MAG: [acyl-carrier-protein] S-malonyltransferase [Candidatus Neomarinimicrobiota bacterium]|nr:MAG: [acyl-carrier-protein] S-malonyltransferase [Candidatus Neomarinimicrobiota bacterium]